MELKDLKVGSIVILCATLHEPEIEIIKRETPKFFEVRGSLYDKETGRERGSYGYRFSNIRIPKEGEVDEIKKKMKHIANVNFIRSVNSSKLEIMKEETLTAIVKLLKSELTL